MSLKLLLHDSPQRALAVVGDSHALVFRHSAYPTAAELQTNGPNVRSSAPKCMVEFSALDSVDFTNFRELHASTIHGTLGLININTDIFLCVISAASRVATVRPRETVQRILSVDFCP